MNLKTLAQSLGLSPATVSRALNGFPEINSKTRERVVQEAKRLGYKPNPVARRLVLGRTDTIGWVYPSDSSLMGDEFFLQTIAGVTQVLEPQGKDFHIVASRANAELATYEHLVKTKLVDGLLVSRTLVEDPRVRFLAQNNFPFVCYGRTQSTELNFSWLDFDNAYAGACCVDYLVGRGHQDIAYLHDNLTLNFAYQRYYGFKEGMEKHNLPLRPDRIKAAGYTRVGGFEATQLLLQQNKPPTAIVIDNTWAGVGAVRAATMSGLEIGKDIDLLLFNGIPDDSFYHTANIAQLRFGKPEEIGQQLAKMVLNAIAEKPVEHILWKPLLIPV